MEKKKENDKTESINNDNNYLNRFLNKKIFVKLKTGRFYSGQILEIKNTTIFLEDKFGELIMFSIDEISSLEPAREIEKRYIQT